MDGHGSRILVVDDDRALRTLLIKLVEQSGHETIEARGGHEGLEKALKQRPDIIITDWLMPAMDGIELVRAVRASGDGYQPYIILVTVLEDDGKLVEAFEAGVDDFLGKPVRAKVVAARLRAGQRIVTLQRENQRQIEELESFARQLTRSNLQLRELSVTDELTGLPNRRYAMERLQHEWAACERDGSALSCMTIDLEGMKEINDLQGHERGDVVLKTVAALLRKLVPPQDIVCRIGGDEFLIICPGAALDSALAQGELLTSAVRSLGARTQGCPFGLGVGVAERRLDVPTHHALINLADRSMYHAKRRGRNQVYSEQLKAGCLIREVSPVC
ncbi:MAG: diguanylate cyclase response regulator [Rhodocyclaceae bacterium]|nr:diguanylate cyclase response regulator [Rhodocyclaceae bacterium]